MDVNTDVFETPTKDAAINIANHLLKQFSIPTRIAEVQDIGASLFVVLYESLFSDQLPGIIRQPVSKADEIKNCQTVIDVLSTDVIHDSLSHIRGESIVAGDLTSIFNLLDIFSHLVEYVMNRIESDADHEDSRSMDNMEPDSESVPSGKHRAVGLRSSPQGRNNKLQSYGNGGKEKDSSVFGNQRAASLNKNENRKAYDDHKVISHEDFYAMTHGSLSKPYPLLRPPSPIKPDQSQSFLGQKTIDSESEVETVKIGKAYDPVLNSPKIAWDVKPPVQSELPSSAGAAIGAAVTASSVGRDNPATMASNEFSATAPAHSQPLFFEKKDPLRSTVGPITYHSHPAGEDARVDGAPTTKNVTSCYKDLRQLVEKTAAMTRLALESSPIRNQNHDEWDPKSVRDEARPTIPSEGVRLAQELNAVRMNPSSRAVLSPGRKKVAFVSSQLEKSQEQCVQPSRRHNRDCWTSEGNAQDLNAVDQDTDVRKWLNSSDESQNLESIEKALQKAKILLKAKSRSQRFARNLALNRQPELGSAHLVIENENNVIKKKQELLRKFYENDHEEFIENVEYILGRDREKAAETEEKYIRKCTESGMQQKAALKSKSASLCPTSKKSKVRHPKDKHQIPATDSNVKPSLTLESEEDLLPYLVNEFPYLHLTEHTWHELWRKGLHQIKALTRAYQEIDRKKSRAQQQLADASQRHQLLSEIMKKQLEHAQRMRDVKEQKQHQILMRNKTHEKRIQSARARRYYNEYQVRSRAKMLKKRTKEELVFRELFKDALNIQRERIKDIRKYAADQRQRQEQQRQNEIDSLENYYHNQFEMLAERLARERIENDMREVAQNKMMDRMKRELRKKMEAEIKQYQEQMFRSDDDAHYRQADADRILQSLHMARYSVKI